MKKLLYIVVVSTFLCSSFIYKNSDKEVYICKGPYSKKYHFNPNCSGLNRCSTEIYKVSLSEAKRMGRGLCGLE